jgi:hypothetical protein
MAPSPDGLMEAQPSLYWNRTVTETREMTRASKSVICRRPVVTCGLPNREPVGIERSNERAMLRKSVTIVGYG